MKTKILSLASAVALLLGVSACQDPHEFSPTKYDEHFDSMTASFPDDDRDENKFLAEFDYDNHIVTIVVPYTYPNNSDSYLEMADLTNMKVQCNLKKGLTLEPALTNIDLTKDTYVTITDGYGVKTPYTIRGEIRKSNACDILDFNIPELGVPGVISLENHTVSLVTVDEIGEQLAEIDLSFGATMSPDPRVEPVNWDNEPVITVIAQDGTTKVDYTFIKANPEKLAFGLRAGSEKILWTKKQSELGIQVYSNAEMEAGDLRFNGSAGLAVIDGNLILNDAGTNKAYVMNMKSGNLISTIDLSALGTNSVGLGNNHRMTYDKHGNLLFSVFPGFNGNKLQLWKMKGLDGQLVKIAEYANGAAVGNSISVIGDLDGDAIITSGTNGTLQFYRWIVKGGQIQSQTPEIIVPGGYAAGSCWGNMDIIYTDGSNPNSNYFTMGYMAHNPVPENANGADNRTCQLLNGSNNEVISQGVCITSNSVENAVDYIEFNNSKYFIHNVMNTLGYGHGASLFMYDVTARNLETIAVDFNSGETINFKDQFGAAAANGTHDRAANGSDVCFHASEDGYYLYIFFEFRNGYVGCVRTDCIDM
ncbi:MAG: DUF5018 domain-containing protein [Bacteroidales bacterium]|nr:DUF5018 domain-containing protein [Bacteroidales bacterium]